LSALIRQSVAYVDARGLQELRARHVDRLLGVLAHGEGAGSLIAAPIPQAWSGLGNRTGAPQFETWLSAAPVATSVHDGVRCARNDDVLFGIVEFDDGAHDFEQEALAHYLRVFALLDRHGYPHLLRVWHYLPQIHLDERGLERYKRFSVARHEAFVRSGREIARDAPAASAVGRRPGATVIAFLAGTRRGLPIENPRQVSAYRYPAQHGPRGPTFARAAQVTWDGLDQLYISGTASIVGHESRHPGDAAAQAEETIHNLRTLVDEAARHAPAVERQRMLFKAYLRPGVAHEDVAQRLRQNFGEQSDVLVLEAEICRRELLLEIEAIALRTDTP
jgi:chorismate lyase / 3-hydroxybenzoate synthase